MTDTLGEPRTVAKITFISADRTTAYFELRNGLVGTYSPGGDVSVSAGDIVFVDNDGLESAPLDLWREEMWVAVVRFVLPNEVVVDMNGVGTVKVLPRPEGLELREGSTVAGFESSGIIRVLSDKPLRTVDISTGDEVAVDQFRREPDPSLTFDEFGGYKYIIERAKELIEVPLERREQLGKIGARPVKGVLLTGPPGTGKTLLARIIASQADAKFYEISGPQVLSKWYGQSEELVRKIFHDAAEQERAIVFFDEIDSLAGQRSDSSHEVSRRIVGQLLTAMDGFTPDNNVVVLATTNRPDDIDAALRRPGRFDWEIHFPLPNRQDREDILRASTPAGIVSKLPHSSIAAMTESWSPAALAAIWSEAALLAVQDDREVIMAEDYFGGYERVAAQRAASAKEKQSERQEEECD